MITMMVPMVKMNHSWNTNIIVTSNHYYHTHTYTALKWTTRNEVVLFFYFGIWSCCFCCCCRRMSDMQKNENKNETKTTFLNLSAHQTLQGAEYTINYHRHHYYHHHYIDICLLLTIFMLLIWRGGCMLLQNKTKNNKNWGSLAK